MLYKGLMVTALSGTLDGLVASHNRGGAYFRQYVIPVDPNTTAQQNMRAAMSNAKTSWDAMTQDERNGWEAYAGRHIITNRLGDRHTISGYNYFCRWALPRFQATQTILAGGTVGNGPPSRDDAGGLEELTATWHTGNSVVRFAWSDNTFQNEDHDYLMCHLGTPQPPTRRWFRGPYSLQAATSGDPDTPIPPYWDVTLPAEFQPDTGQLLHWRLRLSRQDYNVCPAYTGTLFGP